MICADGSTVSFAEFDRQVGSVASWTAQHTQRGDRVAIIADNGADYARLYYGIPRSGRILVLINQRLQPKRTGHPVGVGRAHHSPRRRALPGRTADNRRKPPVHRAHRGVRRHGMATRRTSTARHHRNGRTRRPRLAAVHQRVDRAAEGRAAHAPVHHHRGPGTVVGRSVRSGGVYLLPFPMCHVAGYNMLVHHAAQSTAHPSRRSAPTISRRRSTPLV